MKVTDKYVFFWKEHPFCNFTKCKIRFEYDKGVYNFTSSEQMFMWFKATFFKDYETAGLILKAGEPEVARKLGRLVKNYDDNAWNEVRVDYMFRALTAKFLQNKDLRDKLCDEKYNDKQFVEAAYYDRIWGIGYNEDDALANIPYWGRNELGKLLNRVRNYCIANKEYIEHEGNHIG